MEKIENVKKRYEEVWALLLMLGFNSSIENGCLSIYTIPENEAFGLAGIEKKGDFLFEGETSKGNLKIALSRNALERDGIISKETFSHTVTLDGVNSTFGNEQIQTFKISGCIIKGEEQKAIEISVFDNSHDYSTATLTICPNRLIIGISDGNNRSCKLIVAEEDNQDYVLLEEGSKDEASLISIEPLCEDKYIKGMTLNKCFYRRDKEPLQRATRYSDLDGNQILKQLLSSDTVRNLFNYVLTIIISSLNGEEDMLYIRNQYPFLNKVYKEVFQETGKESPLIEELIECFRLLDCDLPLEKGAKTRRS